MAKPNVYPLYPSRSSQRLPDDGATDEIRRRLKALEDEVERIGKRRREMEAPKRSNAAGGVGANILSLRGDAFASQRLRSSSPLGAARPLSSAGIAQWRVLNATARRALVASRNGFVFITLHPFRIPEMHTLDSTLRDEERIGGFAADDPEDETFSGLTGDLPSVAETSAWAAQSQRSAVSETAVTEGQAERSAARPMQTEEIERRIGGWLRVFAIAAGVAALALLVIVWFLLARNPGAPTAPRVVQFAPSPAPAVSSQRSATAGAAVIQRTQRSSAMNATAHRSATMIAADETPQREENVIDHASPGTHYEIQVLATPRRTDAEKISAALQQRGAPAFVSATMRDNDDFFRVRIGGYASEQKAKDEARRLGVRSPWIVKISQ